MEYRYYAPNNLGFWGPPLGVEWVGQCLLVGGRFLMSVKFCDSRFYGFCVALWNVSKLWVLWCFSPSVGLGLTFKIYCLIIVCHRAKFSSYNYSIWSVKIAGTKNLGVQGHRPLGIGLGVSLTFPVSCVIVQNVVALQRRYWCQIMDKFFLSFGTSSYGCWQPKILAFCLKPNTNSPWIFYPNSSTTFWVIPVHTNKWTNRNDLIILWLCSRTLKYSYKLCLLQPLRYSENRHSSV